MKKKISWHFYPSILAIILLVWALQRHPYGYYTLLRWVTCASAVAGFIVAVQEESVAWCWIMGIIAIVFNPAIPIYLSREIWQPIDIAAAAVLLVSIFLLRVKVDEPEAPEDSAEDE